MSFLYFPFFSLLFNWLRDFFNLNEEGRTSNCFYINFPINWKCSFFILPVIDSLIFLHNNCEANVTSFLSCFPGTVICAHSPSRFSTRNTLRWSLSREINYFQYHLGNGIKKTCGWSIFRLYFDGEKTREWWKSIMGKSNVKNWFSMILNSKWNHKTRADSLLIDRCCIYIHKNL